MRLGKHCQQRFENNKVKPNFEICATNTAYVMRFTSYQNLQASPTWFRIYTQKYVGCVLNFGRVYLPIQVHEWLLFGHFLSCHISNCIRSISWGHIIVFQSSVRLITLPSLSRHFKRSLPPPPPSRKTPKKRRIHNSVDVASNARHKHFSNWDLIEFGGLWNLSQWLVFLSKCTKILKQ